MLATGTRVLVCTQPQDMRKSFDTLAQVARDVLGEQPQSGALYVFMSKNMTRVKVLWWDRNGYCLLYKRLHRALFRLPGDPPRVGATMQLEPLALAELLAGVAHEKPTRSRRLH